MTLTYRDSGVNIDTANRLINLIKPAVRSTHRLEVLSGIGGFGGLFALQNHKYKQPVLVAGTDGVGTKLRLAQQLNQHATIGIDLVAMCVNDVIVQGAEPLFFLDYFATGKLDTKTARAVIEGIAEGCRQAGAALLGGETAEMPGMYGDGAYDLAGFCVGVVDQQQVIDGSNVTERDLVIGIPSNGVHANGYSLINKVMQVTNTSTSEKLGEKTLGEILLTPTIIYADVVSQLVTSLEVHGLCHVTGGGLLENVPRIIPDGLIANIDSSTWRRPEIFNWLQQAGEIDNTEMHRVFNCGIGMVVVLPEHQVDQAIEICQRAAHQATIIGEINSSISKNKITLR